MDMKSFIDQQYEASKASVEASFEGLMKSASADFDAQTKLHEQRMDNYAVLRQAALDQLDAQYGSVSKPSAVSGTQ